jgi:transposase-like protein
LSVYCNVRFFLDKTEQMFYVYCMPRLLPPAAPCRGLVSSWYIFTISEKRHKMTRKIKRYSETFRRQVVSEYEAGADIPALKAKYGIIGSSTITKWIHKYGKQGFRHEVVRIQSTDEARRVHELEKQVKELERALGKVTLEKLKLESILEVLQDDSGRLVKKNEPPSSNGSGTKSSSKASSE